MKRTALRSSRLGPRGAQRSKCGEREGESDSVHRRLSIVRAWSGTLVFDSIMRMVIIWLWNQSSRKKYTLNQK